MIEEKKVVRNIIQIRESKRFTKREVAEKINLSEATYGRIESEKISLSYSHLANIASVFDMPIIDVITYPDSYVKTAEDKSKKTKVTLQIDIDQEDIKADVIKLVFGERVLEIKNNKT